MAIFSLSGMIYFAYDIGKEGKLNNYTSLCIGGIACCGILFGMFSTLILIS